MNLKQTKKTVIFLYFPLFCYDFNNRHSHGYRNIHWIKHLLRKHSHQSVHFPSHNLIVCNVERKKASKWAQIKIRHECGKCVCLFVRLFMQKSLILFFATFASLPSHSSGESQAVFWVNGCLSYITKGKNRIYVRIQHDIKKGSGACLPGCLHDGWNVSVIRLFINNE